MVEELVETEGEAEVVEADEWCLALVVAALGVLRLIVRLACLGEVVCVYEMEEATNGLSAVLRLGEGDGVGRSVW